LNNKTLVIISGPTASGKTALAIRFAKYFQSEILSADSRQVYKELDIGVAMPSEKELNTVKHHFIRSHTIHSPLNAWQYANEALTSIQRLFEKHDILFMVGGSGLFLKAVYHGIDLFPDPKPQLREYLNQLKITDYNKMLSLLEELDPDSYNALDLKNPARVQRALEVCMSTGEKYSNLKTNRKHHREFNIIRYSICLPGEILEQNISTRLDKMRNEGLSNEAGALIPFRHLSPLRTIGYRELFSFFDQEMTEDEAYEKIRVNTRRYAKKQETWLKKEPGFIRLDLNNIELYSNHPLKLLESQQL
jgi:tRNA dimethylallyltransferase